MLPLVRMFPLAVMHTHSLPLFNTILVKKKPEVRRGLDIKNWWLRNRNTSIFKSRLKNFDWEKRLIEPYSVYVTLLKDNILKGIFWLKKPYPIHI